MDRARDTDLALQLFGARPERTLLLVRAAWPAAVGPELARRTEVISIERGVLQVRVADATWRRSLWRMRGEIVGRLRQLAGKLAPRSIAFVEGPLAAPAAPAPAAGRRVAATLVPPPSLVTAAAGIPDDELRAQFLAVAARYLGRFAPEPPRAPAHEPATSSPDA